MTRSSFALVCSLALALALALAPSPAAAERDAIISFSGGMSVIGPIDAPIGPSGPEDVGLSLRAIVSWERAPLPYREPRGYLFGGTIVPEIFAGVMMVDDARSELVGGGLRLEAMFSQRRMGLLEVSARGGFYVAGRGGFFTDVDRSPFIEGAFGEYILIGDDARVGVELAVMQIMLEEHEWAIRGALARAPFENGLGPYASINASFYLGVTM